MWSHFFVLASSRVISGIMNRTSPVEFKPFQWEAITLAARRCPVGAYFPDNDRHSTHYPLLIKRLFSKQWNAQVQHIWPLSRKVLFSCLWFTSSESLRSLVTYQPQRIRLLCDVNEFGELFLCWSTLRMITNTLEKDTLCEVIFSIWQVAITNNTNTLWLRWWGIRQSSPFSLNT